MKFIKTLRDGSESEMNAPAAMKDQLLKDERIRLADEQEPEPPQMEDLIAEALTLKVLGPNGKPASRSVLERWASDRLVKEIAAAKSEIEKANAEAARAALVEDALASGLKPEAIKDLSDEDLAKAIAAAKA